jgi:hypothetical protein
MQQVTLNTPVLDQSSEAVAAFVAYVNANTSSATPSLTDTAVPEVEYLNLMGVRVKVTLNRAKDRYMVYGARRGKYIASSPNSKENAIGAAKAEIYKARQAVREAKKASQAS